MDKLKNYAELKFSNPILLDVLSHHIPNSLLATFVSETGMINLRFRITPPVEAPKNCEQVLSLIFALLESNTESPVGKAYAAKSADILRETVFRLSQVLDGFSSVKINLHTTERSPLPPYGEVEKLTAFTLNRTKSTEKKNPDSK